MEDSESNENEIVYQNNEQLINQLEWGFRLNNVKNYVQQLDEEDLNKYSVSELQIANLFNNNKDLNLSCNKTLRFLDNIYQKIHRIIKIIKKAPIVIQHIDKLFDYRLPLYLIGEYSALTFIKDEQLNRIFLPKKINCIKVVPFIDYLLSGNLTNTILYQLFNIMGEVKFDDVHYYFKQTMGRVELTNGFRIEMNLILPSKFIITKKSKFKLISEKIVCRRQFYEIMLWKNYINTDGIYIAK